MVDTVAINQAFDVNIRLGPTFQTTKMDLAGGYEDRNQDWTYARWRYECRLSNRSLTNIRAFMAHYLGRRGSAFSFPLEDPLDSELTDENIGTGDGTTAAFQITKTYSDTDRPYARPITIVSNLVVKVDGVTQTVTTDYAETDGVITFTSPPAAGQAITVSCDFLIRVRYDEDYTPVILNTGLWSDAPSSTADFTLIEVLR